MNTSITRRQALGATGVAAAIGASAFAQGEGMPEPVVTYVFIARHAEKDLEHADQRDPPLTEAGRARAKLLADMLRDADLAAIYSTPFKRNRDTALPIAERSGAPIRTVKQTDFDGLVRSIGNECAGRSALYVGHTSTVCKVLRALGGPSIPDLDETNYSTLFVAVLVRRRDISATTCRVLRYGAEV